MREAAKAEPPPPPPPTTPSLPPPSRSALAEVMVVTAFLRIRKPYSRRYPLQRCAVSYHHANGAKRPGREETHALISAASAAASALEYELALRGYLKAFETTRSSPLLLSAANMHIQLNELEAAASFCRYRAQSNSTAQHSTYPLSLSLTDTLPLSCFPQRAARSGQPHDRAEDRTRTEGE